MTHVVPLAIETGAVDDLAVHLGRQVDMVVGLRLHGEVGLLGLRGERYALRAEAEVVRFLTDDLQIRSNAAASCACTRTISKAVCSMLSPFSVGFVIEPAGAIAAGTSDPTASRAPPEGRTPAAPPHRPAGRTAFHRYPHPAAGSDASEIGAGGTVHRASPHTA